MPDTNDAGADRYPGAACDVESYVRRGSLPADYRADIEALLGLVASGAYAPPRPEILPLASAAEAHRRIAAGGLNHRLVLDPWG